MGVAGVIVAAGVVAAGATVASASMASDAQTSATDKAIAANQAQQATTRSDLMPYQTAGQAALPGLTAAANAPPPVMDEATLEQTPGYQFNLTQGLKAVQNSAAARGLGVSGAAMKGAATYATGLADSTYQNQFNDAVTNQTNTYNRLQGVATLGENAAAQTGALGQQSTSNVSNALVGQGNAQAAADTAIGTGVSSAANSVTNAYLVNSLIKGNGSNGLYTSSAPANSAGNYAPVG